MPLATPLQPQSGNQLSSLELSQLAEHKAIKYTQELIRKRSVTPEDAGCQTWLQEKLEALGFTVERFQDHDVSNLIAERKGQSDTRFAFAGHTDVVPASEPHLWQVPPFDAEIVDETLIGRGAVDMKSALAVMMAAMEDVLAEGYQPKTCWQWLITSDEEGEAEYGTRTIVEKLLGRQAMPEYCLVGEPTSDNISGDVIKIGRRGAISGKMVVRGKQGHVAYAGHSRNAIHLASVIINALEEMVWDKGSDDFPGTSLQVTYVNSGDFTDNIVPGRCEICFNVRYSHRYTLAQIEQKIMDCLQKLPISNKSLKQLEIEWERHCLPYFTKNEQASSLIAMAERAVHRVTSCYPRLSTSGGTSDGRFIASEHCQVLELGLPNRTIHQVNERAKLQDIYQLYLIYVSLLKQF
ncbi:succinyl-diaminopimelate desuccinylase [Parashewanella curva]|uniref:Succinyl-diaminopimelate desuccinylase n=1 Tax=Parashewanella curva TaxID=2338552 RepID=A0A3L8PSJ1_9GAMM|nr:succinyl-diaminopimelate desuccinylase [Parashewanella curva]RLV58214.1 succinyl-diaminopimelate desuccinylase [Parashewanella curva]